MLIAPVRPRQPKLLHPSEQSLRKMEIAATNYYAWEHILRRWHNSCLIVGNHFTQGPWLICYLEDTIGDALGHLHVWCSVLVEEQARSKLQHIVVSFTMVGEELTIWPGCRLECSADVCHRCPNQLRYVGVRREDQHSSIVVLVQHILLVVKSLTPYPWQNNVGHNSWHWWDQLRSGSV